MAWKATVSVGIEAFLCVRHRDELQFLVARVVQRDAQGRQELALPRDVGDYPGYAQHILTADPFARARHLADFQPVAERIGSEADQPVDAGRVRQGRDDRLAKQNEESGEGDNGPEGGHAGHQGAPEAMIRLLCSRCVAGRGAGCFELICALRRGWGRLLLESVPNLTLRERVHGIGGGVGSDGRSRRARRLLGGHGQGRLRDRRLRPHRLRLANRL